LVSLGTAESQIPDRATGNAVADELAGMIGAAGGATGGWEDNCTPIGIPNAPPRIDDNRLFENKLSRSFGQTLYSILGGP
jgi:hypothetical protein